MIIMVDDETNRMKTFREYLEEIGYEVVYLDKVLGACDFIQDNTARIEAIILDIMMPYGGFSSAEESDGGILTGVVFLKRLRQELLPNVPVIVLTAAKRHDKVRSLRHEPHCTLFLKPTPPSAVAEELKRLGVHPSRRPLGGDR